jgi:hypothetical protein
MNSTRMWLPLAALLVTAGCGKDDVAAKPEPTVAPTSSALAAAKPATLEARKLVIDPTTSKVDLVMEAPVEKIRGRVYGAATGDLSVDFMDVSKTTGLVTVDISGLELFQTKADKDGKFGEETKSDAQNGHARTWLEISADTPADLRKQNGLVQFSIKSITVAGDKNVAAMKGPERKVKLKATGDFLLHGHKAEKTVDLDATFKFDGDKPVSVTVKTAEPFLVGLAEHDVKPRDAFGKLAQKTLETLSPKVTKDAKVSLEYTAKVAN